MAGTDKKPDGCATIDVERTGNRTRGTNDIMFAVGIAHCRADRPLTDRSDIETKKIVIRFSRPPGVEWAEFWKRKGWSERTWREFWSKNVPVLESMEAWADEHGVDSETDLANEIADYLLYLETIYGKLQIVTDTMDFDRDSINTLLVNNCYPALCYDQSTGTHYRSGFHTGSMRRALWLASGSPGPSEWEWYDEKIKPTAPITFEHDHDPENDAASILVDHMTLLAYATRMGKEHSALERID